jgi:hypothetical protein
MRRLHSRWVKGYGNLHSNPLDSATFEQLMQTVLWGLTYALCLVYLYDMIVIGRMFQEHLLNLRKCSSGFKKPTSSSMWRRANIFWRKYGTLDILCHLKGVTTDLEKLTAVQEWPTPDRNEIMDSY